MSPDITALIEAIVERKTPTTSLEVGIGVYTEIVSMTIHAGDRPSHELPGQQPPDTGEPSSYSSLPTVRAFL